MSYKFFQNKSCEYFPCHETKTPWCFSCLFCYCPLYHHRECGGHFTTLPNGVKDCSACLIPHYNYDYIVEKLKSANEELRNSEDNS